MEGRYSRRQFLARTGIGALAIPSIGAILAACTKPGTGGDASEAIPIARPDRPVQLPLNGEPIAASTPIESGATLQVYNWDDYMYKKVLKAFEDQYDCTVEWTSFNNMEEAIKKMQAGQVKPDVFFPTTDYVSRLVETDLIQPLQHELLPNMEQNVWQAYWDPGPYYDLDWRYTVPYTIYTTGVAYRRDRVTDELANERRYDLLWDSTYSGSISYYDAYRDALGMAMVRNGDMDPNSGDETVINNAKLAIMQILNDYDGRLTTNGAYAKLPEGEFTVAQSWSGDIVGSWNYLPKGTSPDVLGYWYPLDEPGMVGNDLIVVGGESQNPRLAHEFINFFLDNKWGYMNFAEWNGYQPPLNIINPAKLRSESWWPPGLGENAVVSEEMFRHGLEQGQLDPDADKKWLDAWNEIKAGGG
jgi:spermidine/putrescine transport system substrate-binding protein